MFQIFNLDKFFYPGKTSFPIRFFNIFKSQKYNRVLAHFAGIFLAGIINCQGIKQIFISITRPWLFIFLDRRRGRRIFRAAVVKIFQHGDIKSFAETPGPGDKYYIMTAVDDVFDKEGFIDVIIIAGDNFFKVGFTDSQFFDFTAHKFTISESIAYTRLICNEIKRPEFTA
jgi:hypothetical protein